MTMTLEQQRDVIQAAIDGKSIELFKPTMNAPLGEWIPYNKAWHSFNFNDIDYRIVQPALRPHWQVLLDLPRVGNAIGDKLFVSIADAHSYYAAHGIRVIRLATEYPPVMLP